MCRIKNENFKKRKTLNVVNPGDSAKRASPGRRAGFFHVNARRNPAFLVVGPALSRGLDIDAM